MDGVVVERISRLFSHLHKDCSNTSFIWTNGHRPHFRQAFYHGSKLKQIEMFVAMEAYRQGLN